MIIHHPGGTDPPGLHAREGTLIVPSEEEARAAQQIYDNPHQAHERRIELANTLSSHYLTLGIDSRTGENWTDRNTANITALRVLAPAGAHAALWADPQKNEDGTTVLQRHARELSWPQSVNADFFDRTFADPREGGQAIACPFSHDERQIATHSIWGVDSLRDGPWRVPQDCPANIPLTSPGKPCYKNISAATMRMKSNIHIAAQTLWDKVLVSL